MSKSSPNFWFKLIFIAVLQCTAMSARGELYVTDLASGQLGSSTMGLFTFTLAKDVSGSQSLTIGTTGSSFDTEIALYDSLGHLVATNDNISSKNQLSELYFGGSTTLAAGTYTVVLSGFNTVFGDGKISLGSSQGGNFLISIESTVLVQSPSIPSYVAKDGNILPSAITEIKLASGRMESGTVLRFDFVLESDVLYGDWLAIITTGSGFDSEIALYDAQGDLVATNDDVSSRNSLSRLSFGLDGDNGTTLLAGAYTLLVSGFNTIFGEGLEASTSSSWEGDFAVYLQSSEGILVPSREVSEPASIHLAWVGLLVLLKCRRRIPVPNTPLASITPLLDR